MILNRKTKNCRIKSRICKIKWDLWSLAKATHLRVFQCLTNCKIKFLSFINVIAKISSSMYWVRNLISKASYTFSRILLVKSYMILKNTSGQWKLLSMKHQAVQNYMWAYLTSLRNSTRVTGKRYLIRLSTILFARVSPPKYSQF